VAPSERDGHSLSGQVDVSSAIRLLDERRTRTRDVDREIYTMNTIIAGNTKLWRLSYEALEDCVADKNVQRTIKSSLRMYFIPDA
jgi:hypothetical protein